jgi:hypothetical protein
VKTEATGTGTSYEVNAKYLSILAKKSPTHMKISVAGNKVLALFDESRYYAIGIYR